MMIQINKILMNTEIDYVIAHSTRSVDLRAVRCQYGEDFLLNYSGELVYIKPVFPSHGLRFVNFGTHLKIYLDRSKKEYDIAQALLLLSGDVETNPGPIASLLDIAKYALCGTQYEYDFWQLPEHYIDSCMTNERKYIGDDPKLYNEFVLHVDVATEIYVSEDCSRYGQLSGFEFTRDWLYLVQEIRNKHDFSGHAVTRYNYRFNECAIPVSLNWFCYLRHHAERMTSFDVFQEPLPYPDVLGDHMKLLLSGDVELNPGPVQSRPLYNRNNDPRCIRLEKALERRDQKIKSLIKHLRQQIKSNKIYTQGLFDTLREGTGQAGELNCNLNRICNFLENSLPTIQSNVQASLLDFSEKQISVKDDMVKLIVMLLIVRLMMTWKKYRLALVIILVFLVNFFGMDKKILELVMELKEKFMQSVSQVSTEEVIYHPYFHTCGKLMFAFMAFFCIGKIPGKQDWDSYILRLDRIPKSITGMGKIMDYCSEYFNLANDYIKMMVLGKTREELTRANGLYAEIHEWAKEVRHYLDLEQRDKIDTDITIANKVEDLYKRGVKYQADTLLDREMQRLVSVTLLPARELYQYVSSSPVKGGGPRMRPICLWLVGESGVGKTEMVYPLCIDVLRAMGLMKKEDFHHQVYGRQVETEFWDGYKGQKIVIYDDGFQMKDDKTAPNPEIFEVIRSCNTFPQHLHMAALHDKNTFSSAELMLYTTNDMNVKIESITFPDAFFNRIGENCYKVRPKLEYAMVVPRGNTGTYYRKLDKTKLDPNIPIDLSIYEFQKVVRDGSTDADWIDFGEPIDYTTFMNLICQMWRDEKKKSIDKLKFLEQYAIRAQVGSEYHDCVEPLYSYDWFCDSISKSLHEGKTLVDIEAAFVQDNELFDCYVEFKRRSKVSKWQVFVKQIDSALQVTGDYLKKLAMEAAEIIRKHPYLAAMGLVGVILSGFALYQWFQNACEEEVVAEVGVSGDAKTAKGSQRIVESWFGPKVVKPRVYTIGLKCDQVITQAEYAKSLLVQYGAPGTVAGGILVMGRFNKKGVFSGLTDDEIDNAQAYNLQTGAKVHAKAWHPGIEKGDKTDAEISAEVGGSGDAKTAKQAVRRVEIDDELERSVTSQGCSDQAAHLLVTDVLQKNTYRLSYFRNDVRYPSGNCTFIRGWTFVIPYHFLAAWYARKLSPDHIIRFSQSKYEDIIQIPLSHFLIGNGNGFDLTDNCERVIGKNGEERDCVIVNLHSKMCHPHRDLVRHFVKVEDQGKLIGKFVGTLATFHENGGELHRAYQWLQQIRPMDKQIKIYYPEDGYEYPAESYTQRDCYEYNAPTQIGDCGSLVGLYNHRLERKIIGMHIAGSQEMYGYACPLTQEALNSACERLTTRNVKNISAQFYFEMPQIVDPLVEAGVPEGLFCPLGRANAKVGQAVKTAIIPSSIQGKLSKPTMRPAILKPTMINGVLHDPLLTGLKKCGVETAVLSNEEVQSAAQDVAQVVLGQYNSMLDKRKYQRVLTYEEAVRGTQDDDFMRAINRTTSPGFPYTLLNKGSVGKTKWMGKKEQFDFESMAAQQLRADVDELLDDCSNGKISNVFFVDTLKDERRENAKVDVGKTRVFSAGPQHFVVAFRKYFLPFAAWLMHNRIDNEIGVGTNVYSLDWERIAKRMRSKGNKVIAGDFGNFDGSLVAQVLWSIFWDIFVPWLNQFANIAAADGMKILKTCLGLWSHLVHSVHIYGDNVYMWTHSQPSGNPFTVIINCLYNSIIMRIAWIRIMKRDNPKMASMKWFRKFVAMITYGDDNVLNISDEIIGTYNQETISEIMAQMKHEYTDEAKSGNVVKFRALEDIFFLKRGFRFCPELQRTVAPLKKEVIYEMLNWTRNTVDPNVILMSNIDKAFREIVNHGREDYDELLGGITRIVDDLPSIPQILTYEAYLHDIEYLADDLYDF
nr:MAG: hypothetical protein 1 [Cripavirus sp.]